MRKIAIYPGSFDPFTLGHKYIVEKSLDIFDQVIIAVGHNVKKTGYYSIQKRIELIEKVFKNNSNIKTVSYTGLTSDFCKEHEIKHIIRGLRNIRDFEMEREIAQINSSLNPNLETLFLLTPAETSIISSSTIRELLELNGNPMKFMPNELTLEDLKHE